MKSNVCKRCGKPLNSSQFPKGYCNTICYDSHMMILDAEQYEDDQLIEMDIVDWGEPSVEEPVGVYDCKQKTR